MRHYVYYRVAEASVAATAAAVLAAQQRLRERFSGLGAELLRRPGDSQGQVTLMEIYDFEGEVDPQTVEAVAAAASAAWRQGARHLEEFEPLG